MATITNNDDTQIKRESLYVYLDQKGCPIEWLNHIRDFYENRRKNHPVYQPYPNKLDNESTFPFGKHKNKRIEDPTVPDSYRKWIISQKEMMLSYPLLTNMLKKYCLKVGLDS